MPQNDNDNVNNKVKEITDRLEQGIGELFESQQYKDYLTTMSKFHSYSFNNIVLIFSQKPNASLIAGYNAWKTEHQRQVVKGAKAIKILAPAPYKVKVQRNKVDPNTRKTILDENGDPVKETVEVQKPYFKVVNVFDVSDTEGKEIPSIGIGELSGNVEKYDEFFEVLKKICPIPIEFEHINTGAKGYYSNADNKIVINKGMAQMQNIKTAIHEMSHHYLHSRDTPNFSEDKTRNSKEVEAESVAYTVCQHYGIDTSDYSFAYIATWSKDKEMPELKASLDIIRKTSSDFIKKIDGHMQELYKEKSAVYENNHTEEKTSVIGKLHSNQEKLIEGEQKQSKISERKQERV
ncbi:MAG: hypothetical protein HDR19_01905 [Lachnospiraceae bacterium]|nr:hypothetical protein [Lachnospiraceae bacterium]